MIAKVVDVDLRAISSASIAGLDHPGDEVAPLGVELGAVLLHLRVPERLRPQVEPQPPVTGQLGLLVGHDDPVDEGLQDRERRLVVERSISSVAA